MAITVALLGVSRPCTVWTETEAKAALNMARDKVHGGELEQEALQELGLTIVSKLALDEWPD